MRGSCEMAGGVRNVYIILVGDVFRKTVTWKMGQWEDGIKLNVRKTGGEVHGAGNCKVLIESTRNVVVCRDDRQGHRKVTCSHPQCIRNGVIVAIIILVEDRLVQIHGFL
jgi:hypothetical protein